MGAWGEGKEKEAPGFVKDAKDRNDQGKHTTHSTPRQGLFCSVGSAQRQGTAWVTGREASLNLGSAALWLDNFGQVVHPLEPQLPEGNTFLPPEQSGMNGAAITISLLYSFI